MVSAGVVFIDGRQEETAGSKGGSCPRRGYLEGQLQRWSDRGGAVVQHRYSGAGSALWPGGERGTGGDGAQQDRQDRTDGPGSLWSHRRKGLSWAYARQRGDGQAWPCLGLPRLFPGAGVCPAGRAGTQGQAGAVGLAEGEAGAAMGMAQALERESPAGEDGVEDMAMDTGDAGGGRAGGRRLLVDDGAPGYFLAGPEQPPSVLECWTGPSSSIAIALLMYGRPKEQHADLGGERCGTYGSRYVPVADAGEISAVAVKDEGEGGERAFQAARRTKASRSSDRKASRR